MAAYNELRTLIRRHKIEMVDLKFVDLFGRWHHVTLPTSAFDARTFERGVPFDGSGVAGFRRKEAGDMALIPDPATKRTRKTNSPAIRASSRSAPCVT
jgi:glutamine synthetase